MSLLILLPRRLYRLLYRTDPLQGVPRIPRDLNRFSETGKHLAKGRPEMNASLLKWLVGTAGLVEAALHLAQWKFLGNLPGEAPAVHGMPPCNGHVWRRSVSSSRLQAAVRLGMNASFYTLVLAILSTGIWEEAGRWALAAMNSPAGAGVLLGAISAAGLRALCLPWAWARAFMVERNGLRRFSESRRFWNDQGLGLSLAMTFGAASLGGAVLLAERPDGYMWIYGILLCTEFLLVWLYPVVVIRFLFPVSVLPEGLLRERLGSFFEEAGLGEVEFWGIDTSRRPQAGNAMLSGLGRARRFLLYDSLVTSRPKEHVAAIVAHEAGHWRKGHQVGRFAVVAAIQGILVIVVWAVAGKGPGHVDLLEGALAAWSVFVLLFQPFVVFIARNQEFGADAFAARLVGAKAMSSALAGLASENRGWAPSCKLYSLWYEPHPPVMQRLEVLPEESLSGK